MIDGLLLLLELGLMLVLLVTVWKAHQRGREDHLGFFAYRDALQPPPQPAAPPPAATAPQRRAPAARRPGGKHHA